MNSETAIARNLKQIRASLPNHVSLVAVSKTWPVEKLMEAYVAGQRIFGENKVQELCSKQPLMPADVAWHMIGHLQSNKVKYIAPFISLIHSVDNLKLLREIDKQGKKHQRVIDCLLQVHIAQENTKFGFDEQTLQEILAQNTMAPWQNVRIRGLMGMASFTDNEEQIKREFRFLHNLFEKYQNQSTFNMLSMGMSGDYQIAIACGSNMIRIGSSIFGTR